MPTRIRWTAVLALGLWGMPSPSPAQKDGNLRYRVDVNLVALTFSVSDSNGRPIHGLTPADLRISEDGIPQQVAALVEGSRVMEGPVGVLPGMNIFILFDTSDHMYRSIPYVCDAVADFLRRLDPADAVAIYTFSRNLSRAAPLTRDRSLTRAGLAQNVSVGDDTALFDCVLLTLRDAATTPGRKAIVVFSDGPDNKSRLSPEDVGTVAVDEGIPVYVISTLDPGKEHFTAEALERLTARTGGKLYFVRKWQAPTQAFAAVHEELAASYTAYYYPADTSNDGFRRIKLSVVAPSGHALRIRTREGYRPRKATRSESN